MQWDKSERNTSEKSTFQTSPNWRANLPRLEGVLFQGLGPWRINFFHFRNHFLKIHAQQIPKISHFKVFDHFWLRKRLSKKKKRVLTPSFPQPTSSSKWVGESDQYWQVQWWVEKALHGWTSRGSDKNVTALFLILVNDVCDYTHVQGVLENAKNKVQH